jgi:hypothetical protein
MSQFLLFSCDDGDIIEETFDFADASVQKCSSTNVLYKINNKEALMLSTPETSFPNKETTVGQPTVIAISGSTSINYKKYVSNTNSNEICVTPTLQVLEEWNVMGGTMEITTTKIFDTTNTTVVAYNHKIVFRNITFVTPTKQIVYDSYEFGNYRTDVIDLDFDYDTALTQTCSGNNLIFKYNGTNALLFDISAASRAILFDHTTGTTKTALINSVNKVVYRVYSGSLNNNFFCASIPPSSPTLSQEWVAQDGESGVSGEIRVQTTQSGSSYIHTIKLFNTTFKKGTLEYNPSSTEYTFGTYVTN